MSDENACPGTTTATLARLRAQVVRLSRERDEARSDRNEFELERARICAVLGCEDEPQHFVEQLIRERDDARLRGYDVIHVGLKLAGELAAAKRQIDRLYKEGAGWADAHDARYCEMEQLRVALEQAADTFDDLERALKILRHGIAAQAVAVARDAARAVLGDTS